LVSVIDEHLQKNATKLSGNSTFKDYYGRTHSPVKRDTQAATTDASEGETKKRRRQTKVKEETEL